MRALASSTPASFTHTPSPSAPPPGPPVGEEVVHIPSNLEIDTASWRSIEYTASPVWSAPPPPSASGASATTVETKNDRVKADVCYDAAAGEYEVTMEVDMAAAAWAAVGFRQSARCLMTPGNGEDGEVVVATPDATGTYTLAHGALPASLRSTHSLDGISAFTEALGGLGAAAGFGASSSTYADATLTISFRRAHASSTTPLSLNFAIGSTASVGYHQSRGCMPELTSIAPCGGGAAKGGSVAAPAPIVDHRGQTWDQISAAACYDSAAAAVRLHLAWELTTARWAAVAFRPSEACVMNEGGADSEVVLAHQPAGASYSLHHGPLQAETRMGSPSALTAFTDGLTPLGDANGFEDGAVSYADGTLSVQFSKSYAAKPSELHLTAAHGWDAEVVRTHEGRHCFTITSMPDCGTADAVATEGMASPPPPLPTAATGAGVECAAAPPAAPSPSLAGPNPIMLVMSALVVLLLISLAATITCLCCLRSRLHKLVDDSDKSKPNEYVVKYEVSAAPSVEKPKRVVAQATHAGEVAATPTQEQMVGVGISRV